MEKHGNAIGIIPARFASTRFPGKPLVNVCGKTMLERVWLVAKQATLLDSVAVATDDDRIEEECVRIGATCIRTDSTLQSGTDRVAQAMQRAFPHAEIICNIQGDEPLLQPTIVDSLVGALKESAADVATPITAIRDVAELQSPTVCKVTLRSDNTAMYFSRNCIPSVRDLPQEQWLSAYQFWKHIGLYAYKRTALETFIQLAPSEYELAESLEQLRLLHHGATYLCVETTQTLLAIDTPADVENVERYILQHPEIYGVYN